jgi:hypothetical protein
VSFYAASQVEAFMLQICENLPRPGAVLHVHVERAYDYDEKRGLWLYRQEAEDEDVHNTLTNTGRVQLHTQCYATASILTNGFNYIALSNDAAAPAATDTALASELTGNGLDRVQGTVTLPTGSGNVTTIAHTFTYTGGGSQAMQKTALFTVTGPPVAGVMNHEVAFTQRTLFTNDTLTLTFSITLG